MKRGSACKSPATKRGCKRAAAGAAPLVRPDGMFRGVQLVLVQGGDVMERQLQIWCGKVAMLGGQCRTLLRCDKGWEYDAATHVLAADTATLEKRMEALRLVGAARSAVAVNFKWLEDCLRTGRLVPVDGYLLREVGWYAADRRRAQDVTASTEGGRGGRDGLTAAEVKVGPVQEGTSYSAPNNAGFSEGASQAGSPVRGEAEVKSLPLSDFGAGSDDEAGPCARDALRARAQSSSRIERVQEWMKREMAFRRGSTQQGEGSQGLTSQSLDLASQESDDGADEVGGSEEGPLDMQLDLNEHITQHLTALKEVYEALGDAWRTLTYQRAVGTLQRLPFRIASAEQLHGVLGMGKQVQDKVKEILGTGTLSKLDSFNNDPKLQMLRLFSSVFGIGAKTALELYARGHRSLDDLRGDANLSRQTQLGLRYHNEMQAKMSRQQVATIEALVRKEAQAVVPGALCEVTGSYRRGKTMCGDVDLLVTHPDGRSHRGLLFRLHQRLTAIGFLTVDLTSMDDATDDLGAHCQTYLGMCRLPGSDTQRRIDIKVYPGAVYAPALVHFTGNNVFNRKVRFFALQLGFKLNEYGLFPVTKIGKRKFVDKASLPCATERDVFAHLGLEYLEPHERNW